MLACVCVWRNGSTHASAVEWMGERVDMDKHACLHDLKSTASSFYNRSRESEELPGYLGFPVKHSQWGPGLIVFGSHMPFACLGQVELCQACRIPRACRSGSWRQHAAVSQRHILRGLVGRSVSSEFELWKCQGGGADQTLSVKTVTHLGLSDATREIFQS